MAALRSHQTTPPLFRLQGTVGQVIAQMEALTAQYRTRKTPVVMDPVQPLFRAKGTFRPETDGEFAARREKEMAALLQHEESERYYEKARHQHAMARADYLATRRSLGW